LLVDRSRVERALAEAAGRPAVLLHAALAHAPLLHRAADVLTSAGRLLLDELAAALWDSATPAALKATIALLRMGASARREPGAYPLLPHRLHLQARPTDGLVACLDPDCCGDVNRKLEGLGTVSPGYHDHCPDCGAATLTIYRCANCGTWGLVSEPQGLRLAPVLSRRGIRTLRYFAASSPEGTKPIHLDVRSGQRKASGRAQLWEALEDCPVCGSRLKQSWKPFSSGAPLTLSILAETALAGLPEFPGAARDWLPARGRRLLAFSDSRTEAARLGPRLTFQHEIQLVRAALARVLMSKPEVDDAVVDDIRSEVERLESELRNPYLGGSLRARKQRALDVRRGELGEALRGGSIESWVEDLKRTDLPARRILQEILDPIDSEKHQADGYSQASWEENTRAVFKDLYVRVGRELSSPIRRAITLETIGLAEITYPGLDELEADPGVLSLLPAAGRDPLKGAWGDFLAALCDSVRSDGAITLGKEELDATYQFGNALLGRWCAEAVDDGWDLIRLIGATPTQRRRRFADAVLRRLGVEADRERLAVELLQGGFRQLIEAAKQDRLTWLQSDQRATFSGPAVDAIRLVFPRLGLRRPRRIFRCDRTGHLWPRSVLGCAPETGCESLSQLDGDWEAELDRTPRVGRQRTEYRRSSIFEIALWAEEHSAQLAPEENRRLQDLFRAGARNILSSTTTLELGIDIGGLSAVLMGNVPPGKANYLQRAGRAGRRADGSSIVIMFARPRPYDREVFQKFGDYLGRPLRRPRIFLERKRVVHRHGHAYLLGEFFRQVYPRDAQVGAMNAFGNVGSFCGVRPPRYWPQGEGKPDFPLFAPDWATPAGVGWWHERPDQGLEGHFTDYLNWLRDYGEGAVRPTLERLFRDSVVLAFLEDWGGFVDLILADFDRALNTWRQEYDELKASWFAVGGSDVRERALANMLRYQLVALCEMTVIEALADRQFLPRYGFPIGVQRLRVIQPDERRPGRVREEDQYRLERGGLLALREYVPGSQLLVGGKLVTSRGLLKHWTGANLDSALGLQGKLGKCERGHEFYHVATGTQETIACPICGEGPARTPEDLLLPRHGFTSAAWDPPKLSSDVDQVGNVERMTFAFAQPARPGFTEQSNGNFGGLAGLLARYREDGELLVYNRGENRRGFAICTKCGYSESEPSEGARATSGRDELPSSFANHAPLTSTSRSTRCWTVGEVVNPLRHRVLAARETTDVLLLDRSGSLAWRQDIEPVAETLARALHIAGAKLLELDTRELGSMVVILGQGNDRGIVVYDNVPGGAGHVHELFKFERAWLEAALGTMYGDVEHHRRCDTACLHCLLTFDAQEAMDKGLLQCRLAHHVLCELLGISVVLA
jgi:hypothetical protein